ncbi:Replication protein C (RepC) [Caballeronia choica]|uniref:Replication protein C (RepC) n=1 Tax=Caballeronia choica TaxID=326476 RepID=A0A158KNJ1_9BURK|nr:replication protein C, IncQ-type [Caballeronia choica]SAL82718.1 Replication protein C (RepC) [Caballeronia choica]
MMAAPRIVRYDSALCAAPVFQPVWRGERPKLNLKFNFDGVVWRWRGPEQLGVGEQTLLLVLLELAAEQLERDESAGDSSRHIESSLYDLNEGRRPRIAKLTVSFYELCRRLGCSTGGSAMAQRRAELQRLCEVTVWTRQESDVEFQSRLLAWEVGDDQGVTVVLNWRLTNVLFGGQYSPVCLAERLSLRAECARALHCALSLRIRPGKTMAFHLDTLSTYIWGDVNNAPRRGRIEQQAGTESPAAVARRRRHKQILEALSEIAALATWTVKTTVNGAVQLTRHPLVKADALATSRPTLPAVARARSTSSAPEAEADPTLAAAVWEIFSN